MDRPRRRASERKGGMAGGGKAGGERRSGSPAGLAPSAPRTPAPKPRLVWAGGAEWCSARPSRHSHGSRAAWRLGRRRRGGRRAARQAGSVAWRFRRVAVRVRWRGGEATTNTNKNKTSLGETGSSRPNREQSRSGLLETGPRKRQQHGGRSRPSIDLVVDPQWRPLRRGAGTAVHVHSNRELVWQLGPRAANSRPISKRIGATSTRDSRGTQRCTYIGGGIYIGSRRRIPYSG